MKFIKMVSPSLRFLARARRLRQRLGVPLEISWTLPEPRHPAQGLRLAAFRQPDPLGGAGKPLSGAWRNALRAAPQPRSHCSQGMGVQIKYTASSESSDYQRLSAHANREPARPSWAAAQKRSEKETRDSGAVGGIISLTATWGLSLCVVAAAIVCIMWWLKARDYEATDDAFISLFFLCSKVT